MALGLVFLHPQGVWTSAAMAVPEKVGYRFMSDYKVVNSHIEKVPVTMPCLTNHRDLEYIFDPEACVSSFFKNNAANIGGRVEGRSISSSCTSPANGVAGGLNCREWCRSQR